MKHLKLIKSRNAESENKLIKKNRGDNNQQHPMYTNGKN